MSPAAIEALIILAAKYGPELVTSLIALFKAQNVTLADVENLFANLKPYSAYFLQGTTGTASQPSQVPN